MTGEARARYMLDANAFDYVLDRAIDPRSVRRLGEIYITTVQHGELLNVPDPDRRKRLLRVLSGIDPIVRPARSGSCPCDGLPGGGAFRPGEPAGRTGRRHGASRKPTRWKDAAIGEIADLEDCVLVTDDKEFRRRAIASGLAALSCADAFAGLDSLPGR